MTSKRFERRGVYSPLIAWADTPQAREAATRQVCANAVDADDAALLLDALGLNDREIKSSAYASKYAKARTA